ncbi:hypothetical protein GE09DRAFT_1174452 [Coniochaeta sp. 2T2.1]|nr:hypothetical protein GE09DRAFT_1174452 [Coniochaeta sp. 2T2.1]
MAPRLLKRSKVSPEVLALEHYHILDRAIRNVLSTELVELTMAQLVDSLPLAASGWDARGTLLLRGHPLTGHESLCNGVLELTRAFRQSFHPTMLSFDSYATQAYQDSSVGSVQFNMRLVELVAIAIHQIAALLFNSQPKLHAGDIDSVVFWKRVPGQDAREAGRRILDGPVFEPRPTLFFHIDYMDYEQYPDGLADVAGYWAEDRIFGGIVLFDRGASGLECKDVYFHSGRKRTTFRIWRLLDSQLSDLVEFITSEEPLPSPPFPILASDHNLHRYDPWNAIAQQHIFRDPWERKIPTTKPEETRDVRSTGDYPALAAMFTDLQQMPQPIPDADTTSRHL